MCCATEELSLGVCYLYTSCILHFLGCVCLNVCSCKQSGVEMHGDKSEEDQDNKYEKELDEEQEDNDNKSEHEEDQNKNEEVEKNDEYQDENLRNGEGNGDSEYKVQGVQSILHESCEKVQLMCNKKN